MGKCENCKSELPEMNSENFRQTDGGQSFCSEFGTYYWLEGELTCDECGYVNLISDQSI